MGQISCAKFGFSSMDGANLVDYLIGDPQLPSQLYIWFSHKL